MGLELNTPNQLTNISTALHCPPAFPSRFTGPVTVAGLQEFLAEAVMGLKPIAPVQLANVDVLMAKMPPFKVLALAFAKGESQVGRGGGRFKGKLEGGSDIVNG